MDPIAIAPSCWCVLCWAEKAEKVQAEVIWEGASTCMGHFQRYLDETNETGTNKPPKLLN